MDRGRRALLAGSLLLSVTLFALANHPLGPAASRVRPLPEAFAHPARILVVAPHPDDDLVGGGAALLALGGWKTVVLLTPGDGFRASVAWEFQDPHPEPSDYLRYGRLRLTEQAEGITRLHAARPIRVIRLGFPDQGLQTLLNRPGPFTSPYTRRQRTTSNLNPSGGLLQRRDTLYAAFLAILQRERPDLVLAPHPHDAHQDHRAAAGLVNLAVADLRAQGRLPRSAHVLHYLVHRGRWPSPPGYHPLLSLAPPSTLVSLGERWYAFPLQGEARARLRRAIAAHRTQRTFLRRLLLSFVRKNGLLADVPVPSLPAGGHVYLPEPKKDTALRNADPATDIVGVFARRSPDGHRLTLAVKTAARPGPKEIFSFRLWSPGKTGLTGVSRRGTSPQATFRLPRRRPILIGVTAQASRRRADQTALRVLVPL